MRKKGKFESGGEGKGGFEMKKWKIGLRIKV